MAQQTSQGIGKRIIALRKRDNLTQDELAKALNSNRSSLNMWERGERELKAGDLQEIANYFGVTTDYLIYGREAQNMDIYRATSLSQEAIEALRDFKKQDVIDWSEDNDGNLESVGRCDALSKALANSDLLNILSSLMSVEGEEPGYYEASRKSDDGKYYIAYLSPDSFNTILFHRLQLIIHAIRTGDKSAFTDYPPMIREARAFAADPRNFSLLYQKQQARGKLIKELEGLNKLIDGLEKEDSEDGQES